MEIKILHDDEWQSSKYFGEKYIIEKENAESVFDNIPCKKVYIKNTDSFELSKEEVLPNIEKYDVGGIKQTSFNPAYLYFTNIEKKIKGLLLLRDARQVKADSVLVHYSACLGSSCENN